MSDKKGGCDLTTASNPWEYYLLKYGLTQNASLSLKTSPDRLTLNIGRRGIKSRKGLLKVIFSLVKEGRLEYYRASGEMVIHSKDARAKIRCASEINAVETVEQIANAGLGLEEINDNEYMVKLSDGTRFIVRKATTSDFQIVNENFIKAQYEDLYPFIRDSVILDIGSNVADTPILFCKKGAKKVYAFEPHPVIFDIASRNIALNGLDEKITIKNLGAGDKDETIDVIEGVFVRDTGRDRRAETYELKKYTFRIKPFSEILAGIGDVDILKMDCEGAEFGSLLSSAPELLRKIKVMLIEYHDDPAKIIAHLTKAGFDVKKKNQTRPSGWKELGLIFATRKS
jgi:FkbM family methyltransferase